MKKYLIVGLLLLSNLLFSQHFEGIIGYELKANMSIVVDSTDINYSEVDTLYYYFKDSLLLVRDSGKGLLGHVDFKQMKIYSYDENTVYVEQCGDYKNQYLDSLVLKICPFQSQTTTDTVVNGVELLKVNRIYDCGNDIFLIDPSMPNLSFDYDFVFSECSKFYNNKIHEFENDRIYLFRRTKFLNTLLDVEIRLINIEERKLTEEELEVPKTRGKPKSFSPIGVKYKVKKTNRTKQ